MRIVTFTSQLTLCAAKLISALSNPIGQQPGTETNKHASLRLPLSLSLGVVVGTGVGVGVKTLTARGPPRSSSVSNWSVCQEAGAVSLAAATAVGV